MNKKVCVFCGSRLGNDTIYKEATTHFGQLMVANQFELVYGAGKVGLMGTVADAVLEAGGKAHGYIPYFLSDKEVAHKGLTSLVEVDTMHERKKLMADYADAFVALPGGMGTMDELCEIITWAQLKLHTKPVILLNVNGYYDALITLMKSMVKEGFLNANDRELLLIATTPEEVIEYLKQHAVVEAETELGKA